MNRTTGVLTTVFEFRSNSASGNTGTDPMAGMFYDGTGTFWGTTGQGHQIGTDSVFKINAATGAFSTITYFATNASANKGSSPYGGLISDGQGYLWGTTRSGGEKLLGTIFKTHEVTGKTTTVIEFGVNGVRGSRPVSELESDGEGFLWGTTEGGGTATYGTVFKVNVSTGELTTVVDFANTGPVIGATPRAGLYYDGAGTFWGTTYFGGNDSGGTIFKVNRASGALTTVYHFSVNRTAVNGENPYSGLVSDGTGFLWGTTSQNGTTSNGTVYKVRMSTGAVTKVVQFMTAAVNGAYPFGGLASDGAGFFAGTTQRGGAANFGTVFKVEASTGTMTKLAEFTSNGDSNRGAHPWGELVSDGAGSFLGTTNTGGTGGLGTIFKVNATTGALTTLLDFTGTGPQSGSGANPGFGALLRHSDGNYYGTTIGGGPGGAGTVFRLRYGPTPVTRPVTDLEETNARLHGTLNPNGAISQAGFEWGTDPTLAVRQMTAAGATTNSLEPEVISADLSNLQPGTTYYYRARGTNVDSTVPQRGAILSFTTPAKPDADGDGLPDAWESTHFGSPAGQSAQDDTDKDGIIELHEYAFGLNPKLQDAHAMPSGPHGGRLSHHHAHEAPRCHLPRRNSRCTGAPGMEFRHYPRRRGHPVHAHGAGYRPYERRSVAFSANPSLCALIRRELPHSRRQPASAQAPSAP